MKSAQISRGVFFAILFLFAAIAPAYSESDAAALLSKKMDQVLENQKLILQTLEELKQELHIVKLRATR